jgi:hypothetical protein
LLEGVESTVLAEGASLRAFIDHEHFTDLLIYILEDLIGTGARQIEIHTGHRDKNVVVTVAGNVPSSGTGQKPRTWQFLRGLSERAGGTLAVQEHEGFHRFEFTAMAV